MRVVDVPREVTDDFQVLLVAVGAQSLVALEAILLAQRIWVEAIRVAGCGRVAGIGDGGIGDGGIGDGGIGGG